MSTNEEIAPSDIQKSVFQAVQKILCVAFRLNFTQKDFREFLANYVSPLRCTDKRPPDKKTPDERPQKCHLGQVQRINARFLQWKTSVVGGLLSGISPPRLGGWMNTSRHSADLWHQRHHLVLDDFAYPFTYCCFPGQALVKRQDVEWYDTNRLDRSLLSQNALITAFRSTIAGNDWTHTHLLWGSSSGRYKDDSISKTARGHPVS